MVIALMPLSMMAQDDDDMYFASSKKKAKAKAEAQGLSQRFRQVRDFRDSTYYAGSKRSLMSITAWAAATRS